MTLPELARLAGEVLQGKTQAAGLPEPVQHALLDFLMRGKVVLFEADPENPEGPSRLRFPALESPELAPLVGLERERCDGQRRALLEAQATLAAADIPLLLFKTTGPYPCTSSNVDALVPPGSLDRAAELLAAAGHHEMTHYWEPGKRLLRHFRGRGCDVMIHLHEGVSWIVLSFLDREALWEGARSSADAAIRHPAPEHTVAALLAHAVYESNRVSAGDVEKVRGAVAEASFDWGEVVETARAHGWQPGLALARAWYAAGERGLYGDARLDEERCRVDVALGPARPLARITAQAQEGQWPLELPKRVTKPYFFRKLLVDNRSGPRRVLLDLAGLALQVLPGRLGLRPRPASLICLCGIDGSGKSTQANAVRSVLAECEVPVRAVWMRGGYGPLSELLKRVVRRASGRVPGTGDETSKTAVYRAGRARWLWVWWVTLEQIVQGFTRVRVPLWLGRSVVTERYVIDTLVDLAERLDDPDFADRLPARLMRALTPRPRLVLMLDLPGAAAFARKSDAWSPEILESRRALYLRSVQGRAEVAVLDAQRQLDDLEREVVDRTLRAVLGRIGRSRLSRVTRDAWR